MSSLSQEESRSISESTTWGKRRMMAEGKHSVGYSTFLGYDKGEVPQYYIKGDHEPIISKEMFRIKGTEINFLKQ